MTRSQPEDGDKEYVGSVWTLEEVTGGCTYEPTPRGGVRGVVAASLLVQSVFHHRSSTKWDEFLFRSSSAEL